MIDTSTETGESQVGEYLINEVLEDITGKNRDMCYGDKPHNIFFASNIESHTKEDETNKNDSIGLRFKPDCKQLNISVRFSIFVPEKPSFEDYNRIDSDFTYDDKESVNQHPITRGFYTKRKFSSAKSAHISNDGEIYNAVEDAINEIEEDIDSQIEEIFDSEGFHDMSNLDETPEKMTNLDEEGFEDIINTTELEGISKPDFELVSDVTNGEVIFRIRNTSDNSYESQMYFYNPKIEVEGEFEPYKYKRLPEDDYRYQDEILSLGNNVTIESETMDNGRANIETVFTPVSEVKNFEFEDKYDTSFNSLSEDDTIDILYNIHEGMVKFADKWSDGIYMPSGLSEEQTDHYYSSVDEFREEVKNFKNGIKILENHPDVLEAFKIMNETNHYIHCENKEDGFEGWRLFQIVFIVSNLWRIVRREDSSVISDYDESAEVLWFPTGGGKTEAYLGLISFNMFYDRIRGKQKGLAAWMRFPLRLLGRQQTRRFLEVIMGSNEKKREKNIGGEDFSLGIYMGSSETPNKISDLRGKGHLHKLKNNEIINSDNIYSSSNLKMVDSCPICSSETSVTYEPSEERILLKCIGDCGRLPIYVTDEEIYRELPTVLIGTLDKITQIHLSTKFSNLIGNVSVKCSKHGYGRLGECIAGDSCSKDGRLNNTDISDFYDPIPTLHMVDEVHMLQEERGAFSAHYETTYMELCMELDDCRPEVVTSTATISQASKHMDNLFVMEPNVFPKKGPSAGKSFYGEEKDSTAREYIGVNPCSLRSFNSVIHTMKNYHENIMDLRDRVKRGDIPNRIELDASKVIKYTRLYEVSIAYFLRRRTKDRYINSVKRQMESGLESDGYDYEPIARQLSSDIDDPDLEPYENLSCSEGPDEEFEERVDTIGATKFISHGIDVDAFNFMIFGDQPSQSFEYIQSSSRVGRQDETPGFILGFYNDYYQRDEHRYKYFDIRHNNMYRNVEPISIDRSSKFALEETFPGVITSVLMSVLYPKWFVENNRREKPTTIDGFEDFMNDFINGDFIRSTDGPKKELKQIIKRCYRVDESNMYEYKDKIENKVENLWVNYWLDNLGDIQGNKAYEGKPLFSLIYTGDKKDITLDETYAELSEVIKND
jgi:hypothetical protein